MSLAHSGVDLLRGLCENPLPNHRPIRDLKFFCAAGQAKDQKIGRQGNQVPKEVFGRIGPHHVLRIRSFITEVEFWVV